MPTIVMDFSCVICGEDRDLHGPILQRADGVGPVCQGCKRKYEIDEKIELRAKKESEHKRWMQTGKH